MAFSGGSDGGAREDRTPDLSSAIAGKMPVPERGDLKTRPKHAVFPLFGPYPRSASDPLPDWPIDLYFVKDRGLIKIGKSQDAVRRLAVMRSGNPRIRPVALLSNAGWQEKVWHFAFAHDRRGGEWFVETPELMKAISAADAAAALRARSKESSNGR